MAKLFIHVYNFFYLQFTWGGRIISWWAQRKTGFVIHQVPLKADVTTQWPNLLWNSVLCSDALHLLEGALKKLKTLISTKNPMSGNSRLMSIHQVMFGMQNSFWCAKTFKHVLQKGGGDIWSIWMGDILSQAYGGCICDLILQFREDGLKGDQSKKLLLIWGEWEGGGGKRWVEEEQTGALLVKNCACQGAATTKNSFLSWTGRARFVVSHFFLKN